MSKFSMGYFSPAKINIITDDYEPSAEEFEVKPNLEDIITWIRE